MEITNYTNYSDIEDLITFISVELNIGEDVGLMIICNDELLNKLSTNVKYEAILHCNLPHSYILYVKEDVSNIQRIICHEMIHLEQWERGDLEISKDFREIKWKGTVYTNAVPYDERDWEREAFSRQNQLWRKYKK